MWGSSLWFASPVTLTWQVALVLGSGALGVSGWVWCSLDHVLALTVIMGGRPVELAELLCPSPCVGLGLGTLARPVTWFIAVEAPVVWA